MVAGVAQTVTQTGLFSKKYIYKTFYDMNDAEIAEVEKELEEEQKKASQQAMEDQQMQMGAAPGGAPGGAPGDMGMAPPQGAPPPLQSESTDVTKLVQGIKKYKMLSEKHETKE